jgi:hypothetical protein
LLIFGSFDPVPNTAEPDNPPLLSRQPSVKAMTMTRQSSTFAVYENRSRPAVRRFTRDEQPDTNMMQQLAQRMDRIEQVILSIINGNGCDCADGSETEDVATETNANDADTLNRMSPGANVAQPGPKPGQIARSPMPRPVTRDDADPVTLNMQPTKTAGDKTVTRLDWGRRSDGLDNMGEFTTDQQRANALYRRIEQKTNKVIGTIQAKNAAAYRRQS